MRPPEFWKAEVRGRDSALVLRAVLTPLSWLYAWGAAKRIASTRPKHVAIPVLCVGNLTLGGAGKTPLVRAIRARLGPHAHALSRGYGGKIDGPLRVTPDMDAAQVGDEPLLHAADGPAWIARDRVVGALAAAQAGARALVLDDGFQNPSLAKDLSIVAVDTGFGVGNGAVFPAGPLRERLRAGLARADAIVLLDSAGASSEAAPSWLSTFEKPILRAHIETIGAPPQGPLVAFAGIARPEKFFDTLTAKGAEVEEGFSFADHYVFTEHDLAQMAQIAQERGARLITTEKDHVRLSPPWRARVDVLRVAARFADEAALGALLAPIASRMN